VRGAPTGESGWRIGIQHPLERHSLAAVVELRDMAIATSGAYERGDHVRDPHTGQPPTGLLSVSVVGPDIALADAFATTAFAMGQDGAAWTTGLPDGYEALSITSDQRVLTTDGFDSVRVS
jgi:thiamine biosynthesis lipoprotein